MAKKHLEQYDENGQRVEIYLNDDEVMVDDKTLAAKLEEMQEDIDDAASQGGIQQETDPTVPSWAKQPTKPTYTAQEVGAMPADTPIPSKTSALDNDSGFITLNDVPEGTVVEPGTATPSMDGNAAVGTSAKYAREDHRHPHDTSKQDKLLAGNGITIAQDGKTVSVDAEVVQPVTADGTFTVRIGNNEYTINLNHEHQGMAKLEKFVASNPPASMANDTIYAQVDNLNSPTEIQSLWLFGCEFAGGIPDTGLPQVTKPLGNVINLGALSASGTSKVIQIKARNLTNNLTVTVGTGLTVTYNGTTASSVTIPKADAILGVDVTVAYTGTAELDDGAMTISHGNDMLASYTVTVHFPSGYTACEYIQGGSNTTYINTGVNVTSELRVVGKYKYQPSVEYSAIFGMYLNDQAVYRGLTANTPYAMFFQIAGSSFGTAYRVADTNPHEFDLNKERLIFDGAEYPSETSSEWTTDRKLYLFSMNNASNNNVSEGALPNASLYYFKIYNGSSLVRDFRPAYEQSTQKYGMYDLVQGLFYPSSGNGNFSGQQITQ